MLASANSKVTTKIGVIFALFRCLMRSARSMLDHPTKVNLEITAFKDSMPINRCLLMLAIWSCNFDLTLFWPLITNPEVSCSIKPY